MISSARKRSTARNRQKENGIVRNDDRSIDEVDNLRTSLEARLQELPGEIASLMIRYSVRQSQDSRAQLALIKKDMRQQLRVEKAIKALLKLPFERPVYVPLIPEKKEV
jgi:hypothetical protein